MSNPFAHKSAEEIAAMWQVRALYEAKGKLQHVLLRSMVNEYIGVTATSWKLLLSFLLPGFDHDQPLLDGHAKIMPSGRVVSEVFHWGEKRLQVIYRNKDEFISESRKLADKLKLNDADRIAMFELLAKWITADLRVGLHGEKLAS